MPDQIRIFSFGGGVQSMACLVLAARREIDFPVFLFADVGADSENPETLAYLREVALPYAARVGIELRLLPRLKRDGSIETLWGRIMKPGSRSLPIPVRMNDTAAPGNRSCTVDFKIKVIDKALKALGATAAHPAITGIGISLDEAGRARQESGREFQKLVYPLLDLGLRRSDCETIIAKAGLPVPPKSSCFFCPYHSLPAWQSLYDRRRDLFEKSVLLERTMNERRKALGKDPVWLTRFCKPLDQVVDGSHQNQLQIQWEEGPEDRHNCGPFVCSNPF